MRFLVFILLLTSSLSADKVYQSAEELPKSHRMIWSVKQRDLPNPTYNYSHDQRGLGILQTWEPDQLPPETHIVHGIEPVVFNSVVNYFRTCPDDISHEDLIRYYLDFFFTYKQVIAASLIQLSDNPLKAQQVTYTACGFVLDVPPVCILTAGPYDLYSPCDSYGSSNPYLQVSSVLVREGPQAMRDQLLEWGNQKPLQWAPRGLLSHSYKINTDKAHKIIPNYNEIVILPRNLGTQVKVKGIFINTADDEVAGEEGTFESSTDFIEPMRQLAKDLELPVLEFATNNDIAFPVDDSRFEIRSIVEKCLFKNTHMWNEQLQSSDSRSRKTLGSRRSLSNLSASSKE